LAETSAPDGAGVPAVDPAAGIGDEPTASVTGVTVLLDPTSAAAAVAVTGLEARAAVGDEDAVLGVDSTCAMTDVVRFGAPVGITFLADED
jgi:hypothetical protein